MFSYTHYIEYISYSYAGTVEIFTYCAEIEGQNKTVEVFMLLLTYSVSFVLFRPGLGFF